jgi:hypothetical protein
MARWRICAYGHILPESVYQAWKGYDFGQKKTASPYLSAVALGILVRCGRVHI